MNAHLAKPLDDEKIKQTISERVEKVKMPVMNDYEATAAIRSFLGAWKKQAGNRERILL